MQQHGLPMAWYVQQPTAAPQLISTTASPGPYLVNQGHPAPYVVVQAAGGGPQQFVHGGPQAAPQVVWIQQPNHGQPIFMNMASQIPVQHQPQMYVVHSMAHAQHTPPATPSAIGGQTRQGSAVQPSSVPILPVPSPASTSLHTLPFATALPPAKQSHSYGPPPPPQPWQMQILSAGNPASFNTGLNLAGGHPVAPSKQQDSHSALSLGKRSFASTTTTHHLTHESEQPDPGVIHSVRPFLGPKQVGSILETPSKLPLLDVLPPLAKRKPRPLLQPVPSESN